MITMVLYQQVTDVRDVKDVWEESFAVDSRQSKNLTNKLDTRTPGLFDGETAVSKLTWAFLRKMVLDYMRRYSKQSDNITQLRHFTKRRLEIQKTLSMTFHCIARLHVSCQPQHVKSQVLCTQANPHIRRAQNKKYEL